MLSNEKITFRERRERLIAELWETVSARRVWQERPYTFVKFRVTPPPNKSEASFETYGFSKVCYPDHWREEKGIELAEKRAMKRAANIIIADWDK